MKSQSESTPKKMYWSDNVRGTRQCPDCQTALVPKCHSYLMVLRHGESMDSRIVGSGGGHFCTACPVVVLDRARFDDYAATTRAARTASDYVVLGLVDLSAVPEDKRHLPFDEVNNPLPLVMFTNLHQSLETRRS
ncbi:MAG: hypothetical protein Q7J82_09920 [Coriobacteriia bacterium]|nr:hypothetical protein [Coriobacteriia bacterium]